MMAMSSATRILQACRAPLHGWRFVSAVLTAMAVLPRVDVSRNLQGIDSVGVCFIRAPLAGQLIPPRAPRTLCDFAVAESVQGGAIGTIPELCNTTRRSIQKQGNRALRVTVFV